jgi:hypothetical protein
MTTANPAHALMYVMMCKFPSKLIPELGPEAMNAITIETRL